jgi:hypothetical protein
MSNQLDRRPLGQGAIVVPFIAGLSCAFASTALASQAPAQAGIGVGDFSARVAAVVERVRLIEPALLRERPRNAAVALWSN